MIEVQFAWRSSELVQLPPAAKSVTGANGRRIHLHVVERAYTREDGSQASCKEHWIRYLRHFSKYDDGREDREVAEPTEHRGPWPGPRRDQCHGRRPGRGGYLNGRHVYDEDDAPAGHHLCKVCGHPAWIEFHGNAIGQCSYCGHGG